MVRLVKDILRLSRFTLSKRCYQYKFMGSFVHQFKTDKSVFYPKREEVPKKLISQNRLADSNDRSLNIKNNDVVSDRKNYYSILGLKEQASSNDIKRAYYILAKKFHPDRISSSSSSLTNNIKEFQEISEAYNVLSDESKRLDYDRLGLKAPGYDSVPRPIAPTNFRVSEQTRKLNQYLKNSLIQTGKELSTENTPPPAIYNPGETELSLTFLQAVQGTTKDVVIKTLSRCHLCTGMSKIGSRKSLELCKKCNGSGQYKVFTKTYKVQGICDACRGTRYVSKYDCKFCGNRGYLINETKVPVKVPPGVNNNDYVQLPHPDGKQMVKVKLKVMENNHFKRIGNDIYTEKQLTLTEAVLGGKFKIRGIFDEISVNVDPGTESHTEHRLIGKGVKSKSGTGDHIVTFKVKMPKTLTPKQRSLITLLQRIETSIGDVENLKNT